MHWALPDSCALKLSLFGCKWVCFLANVVCSILQSANGVVFLTLRFKFVFIVTLGIPAHCENRSASCRYIYIYNGIEKAYVFISGKGLLHIYWPVYFLGLNSVSAAGLLTISFNSLETTPPQAQPRILQEQRCHWNVLDKSSWITVGRRTVYSHIERPVCVP